MRAAVICSLLLVAGCDDSTPTDDAGDGRPDAGAFDAGAPDAGPPAHDPARFDCTAAAVPDRASPRPLHCATDPSCTERLVSAHRGAGVPGVLAPEDTLSAIRAAIALGADMTELDVRATMDGALVLMHDETVDRTTMGTGRVDEMTLAEIQALAIRPLDYPGDFSCERVPTLAEAIEVAAGRITLTVEPKTDSLDDVVAAIAAAGQLDGVLVDAAPELVEAALATEPGLRFFVRAETADAVAPALMRFEANPPRYVHLGASTDPDLLAAVDGAGQRAFGLAFGADIAADLRGTPQPYLDLWDDGVQILQCNRPDLAVAALR